MEATMTKLLRSLVIAVGAFVLGFALTPGASTAEEVGACSSCGNHCPSEWSFYSSGEGYVPVPYAYWCSGDNDYYWCEYQNGEIVQFNCSV
jgi:hypothetical protein